MSSARAQAGGTVAARLAENGQKVLVLEAGGDPFKLQGGDAAYPNTDRLPDDYSVPVFHACATEDYSMRWDYFVRHYADDAWQRRDGKYVPNTTESLSTEFGIRALAASAAAPRTTP